MRHGHAVLLTVPDSNDHGPAQRQADRSASDRYARVERLASAFGCLGRGADVDGRGERFAGSARVLGVDCDGCVRGASCTGTRRATDRARLRNTGRIGRCAGPAR